MTARQPLKPGSKIVMPNGGRYVIGRKISEGGLAILYEAETAGNGYPVIVKELFPREKAERVSHSANGKKKDRVYAEEGHEVYFKRCRDAFEKEGELGSLASLNTYQIIGFSDCGDGYAILPRWSRNTCTVEDLVSSWRTAPPNSIDPIFTDLGRLRNALYVISSILSAVATIHDQGMLHLDLSQSNVAWSGDQENGTAFLTDFGCAVKMDEHNGFPVAQALSYSVQFAAPEYKQHGGVLTKATDLYAVGKLLAYLCFDIRAFGRSGVENLVQWSKLPQGKKSDLLRILHKALAAQPADRYQSAREMQEAVDALRKQIQNPVNPDATKNFTLYSLKSMLEGSMDTRYSWAEELIDRKHLNEQILIPEEIHKNITTELFPSDANFLTRILPSSYLKFLRDNQITDREIMTGQYAQRIKAALVERSRPFDAKKLVSIAGTLINDREHFNIANNLLLDILTKSDELYLRKCQNRCEASQNSEIALGMLIVYALLGPELFKIFTGESPEAARAYFMDYRTLC